MKFGTISIDSGVIIIPIVVGGKILSTYEVNVNDTTMTLNQWLDQLSDKRWFTPTLKADFQRAYNYLQSLPK
ncbi:MAG: hypothetical protein K2H32_09355 [Muribaculaceae bacterium]|nr:hypothetical protein [Muribaculaceae bacterium]